MAYERLFLDPLAKSNRLWYKYYPAPMKNTQIPPQVLNFASLKDLVQIKIPTGFDTTYVLNLYHLIKSGTTAVNHIDPMHTWLEKIVKSDQVNVLIFLLQTQEVIENKIQDTLG